VPIYVYFLAYFELGRNALRSMTGVIDCWTIGVVKE